MATILFDMFLNITWFPARVHKTYGFRSSKETLLTTCEFLLIIMIVRF